MSQEKSKLRGLQFSDGMVKAIQANTKTQTRRVMKVQPPYNWVGRLGFSDPRYYWRQGESQSKYFNCPYGAPGQLLRVKEAWAVLGNEDNHPINDKGELVKEKNATRIYRSDYTLGSHGLWYEDPTKPNVAYGGDWRNPMMMPGWASRLTLQVTKIRAERLHTITPEDALAEGIIKESHDSWFRYQVPGIPHWYDNPVLAYAKAWNILHPKEHAWNENPYVWVVEFIKVPTVPLP